MTSIIKIHIGLSWFCDAAVGLFGVGDYWQIIAIMFGNIIYGVIGYD